MQVQEKPDIMINWDLLEMHLKSQVSIYKVDRCVPGTCVATDKH